jgi:hypothetical protein
VAVTAIQNTSSPKAGRRFEPTHEVALHPDALAACASLPGAHRGVLVVREMTGPIGIPDLTALVGDPSKLQERLGLDVPPVLNRLDAAIVATTPVNVPRSAEALAKSLDWPIGTITRRIPGLVRNGALIQADRNRYVRPEQLQPLGRLYAIEAKVRDRRAAISQARTYGAWADGYVLIMGSLSQRPLQLLTEDVDADRGGLMVNGEWLRRPRIIRHDHIRRLWSSEHLVEAVLDPCYQPSVAP